MVIIIDIVIAVFGIYMIAAGLKMKKTGKISSIILAEEEMKKCKDEQGFISFIYWKEALVGAALVIVGALGLVSRVIDLPRAVDFVEILVFLAVFLWFWRALGTARERFLSHF